MVLICTPDEGLAKALRRSIRGKVTFATSDGRVGLYDRCVELAAELRPAAVLLDVRAGGSAVRIVERVPWVLRASPLSAVVVMTLAPSAAEVDEIAQLGAYTYLDLTTTDLPFRASETVKGAVDASSRARRRAGVARSAHLH